MKCFFHKSDLGGRCSGAIVKYFHPECEMIGVDYNDLVPSIDNGETIFVVDFSFSISEMDYLNNTGNLIWIDHHKSAIEGMEKLNIKGKREIGKAACELAWEYFAPNRVIPYTITLLGDYDIWDHSDPFTLIFQYGFRNVENTLPENQALWSELFESDIPMTPILKGGELILDYQTKQDKMYVKGMSYEAEFEGYRAIVMNKAYANSKVFDSVYDPDKHDIMILFGVKPCELKYSIYCDKPEIDVSEIAVKYGGGGHKGAAGFYSKTQIV